MSYKMKRPTKTMKARAEKAAEAVATKLMNKSFGEVKGLSNKGHLVFEIEIKLNHKGNFSTAKVDIVKAEKARNGFDRHTSFMKFSMLESSEACEIRDKAESMIKTFAPSAVLVAKELIKKGER